ncbi:MAG TPA: ABC transporter permease [Acidobacteriota bacterium]|nr:ABC transporter permease [Acidobacteriota bacterium]
MKRYHPLKQLLTARVLEFVREPAAVFWVYGFPLILAIGLGIAFRNRPVDLIYVDVQQDPMAAEVVRSLTRSRDLVVETHPAADCHDRLRLGKTSLVVVPGSSCTFVFDPSRPESVLARQKVDDVLQRSAGRRDPMQIAEKYMTEPGARYIDFLVPGLLGMNLMGSGMWGVGFVIVDLRVRKLLKRFVATPMHRSDFLWSLIGGRLAFMIPEVVIILGAGALLFKVAIKGNPLSILLLSFLGAMSFAGLGLLVACRAQRIETVSGLMNLIMLPMWMLSGIFFSPDRFPNIFQPLVQALPLTQLNYALRAVILEGATLASQSLRLLILAAWGGLSFFCALRWFRWN